MTQEKHEHKRNESDGLLFLGLKPFQIPIKFLYAFKLGKLFLLLHIEGILFLSFRNRKLMPDFTGGFQNIVAVHGKEHIKFLNPIFHIHSTMIESLRFRKSKILLDYEFQVLELNLIKIVFSGGNIAFAYFSGFGGGSKSHIRQAMVRPVINQLRGGLTTDRPKQLILYLLEKVECNLRIGIIVLAEAVNVFHLLVKHFFLYPYLANALKQLLEVVHGTSAFESLVVQREPLDNVIAEPLCCPDAELCALLGFNPIPYRYDYIKAIIFHGFVRICNLQKMQIAFFDKLPFLEYIADMAGDYTYISLKQFAHLALGQPYGLIGKKDIHLDNSILGPVYYNLVIHNRIKTSAPVSVRNKVTLCEPTSEAELNIFRESVTNHLMQK